MQLFITCGGKGIQGFSKLRREMVLNYIRRDIRACLGSWKSASSCVLWGRIRVMLAISRKADTLWVHCIHTYMIKHHCRWYMPLPQDSSWTMRKIFKLPPLAQSVIKSVKGNGQSTFLWPDNWHPMGPSPPLHLVFGDRTGFNMGRNLHAEVSSVIENGRWRWPRTRSSVTQEIMHATPSFLPH